MTIKTNEPDPISEARAVLQGAIPHLKRGWCREDYARTADDRPTSPLAEDATSFCIDGACMLAQQQIGASRESMHLVRKALTLWCSASRGTRAHPFWCAYALNDDPKTTQFTAIAAVRAAAGLVHVAHLVVGSHFPAGWTRPILKAAREKA